jgi:transmembrane sensor
MNSLPRPPAADFDEQAALWAARLEGGALSAADRGRLDAWMLEAPAHRERLSEYCQLSVNLQTQLPALAAAGALSSLAGRDPVAPRAAWAGPRRIWAGAALAAAAGVAVALWWNHPVGPTEQLATTAAQRRSFVLPDGTRVQLNAHTQVRVENRRRERHVRLSGGEAFFEVTKDRTRPFIVETPAGTVKVTGTVFDVRSEAPTNLEVTVVEGSVQVQPTTMGRGGPDAVVSLVASDQLDATPAAVAVKALSGGELDDTLAWRRGQIVCRNTPLGAALARFAEYNGRSIAVSAAAGELTVGGIYSLDDLDGFLEEVAQSLHITVAPDGKGGLEVNLRRSPN